MTSFIIQPLKSSLTLSSLNHDLMSLLFCTTSYSFSPPIHILLNFSFTFFSFPSDSFQLLLSISRHQNGLQGIMKTLQDLSINTKWSITNFQTHMIYLPDLTVITQIESEIWKMTTFLGMVTVQRYYLANWRKLLPGIKDEDKKMEWAK